MFSLPDEFLIFLSDFCNLFSTSVWSSAQLLVTGTILWQGDRTVSSALRAVGLENTLTFRNYHNVLSRAEWSGLAAAKTLFGFLVNFFVPSGSSIIIGADETNYIEMFKVQGGV